VRRLWRKLHDERFIALKWAVEFITCFFIIAGVIRHW
jgi:hypothetical protein